MSERITARREALVTAAAETFALGGFEKTSVDQIARRAGVTRMLVYRYFESKEHLHAAVLEQVAEALTRELAAIEAPVTAYAVTAAHFRVAVEFPAAYQMFWEQARHDEAFGEHVESLVSAVHRAAAELLATYVDLGPMAGWAAEVATAISVTAALSFLRNPESADRARIESFAAEGLAGLVTAWVILERDGVVP